MANAAPIYMRAVPSLLITHLNVFWRRCSSLQWWIVTPLTALFPHLQDFAPLICQLCLSLPPSSRHDGPRFACPPPPEPPLPGMPPQGVCVVIYSASSKRLPCLHFPSSFLDEDGRQSFDGPERLNVLGGCWSLKWG